MANKVYYKDSVGKDLKGIDPPEARRIVAKIEKTLIQDPHAGKQLKGAEYHSLRVGSYRVIYIKVKDGVLIARIGHRKDVYHNL